MAKGSRGRRRVTTRHSRSTPYPLPSWPQEMTESLYSKKCSNIANKKDWEDVTCSVCMEYPHNVVLLLCSSHDKGCRPYMCGTSHRFSNCLDQYKRAYTKVISPSHEQFLHDSVDRQILIPDSGGPTGKCEVTELACPLCRGQVKGWTVVEPLRDYLNSKKRSCTHDSCSFVGNYKELRKHVTAYHPFTRPHEVDPVLEQKWRRLEREQERDDVISTISSTVPGAMVLGDYVIEGASYGVDIDDMDEDEDEAIDADGTEMNASFGMTVGSNLVNVLFLLHAFGQSGDVEFGGLPRQERAHTSPTTIAAATVRVMLAAVQEGGPGDPVGISDRFI